MISHDHLKQWWRVRPWERHSIVLAVAGFVYIAVGYAYIRVDPTPERTRSLAIILRWAPFPFWGALFVIAGVLALLSSRWPIHSTTWGYAVLSGLSGAWAAAYLMGVIIGHSPKINLTGALVWGLMAFMWWGVAGLLNPTRVVVISDGLGDSS